MPNSFELRELTIKHRRMAYYIARGASARSVARRFNIHENSFYRIIGSSLFRAEVERYEKIIEERNMRVLEDAVKPIHDNLEAFSHRLVEIATAKDAEGNYISNDSIALKAMALGFQVAKPSIKKDEELGKRQPELRIRIDGSAPELRVIEGSG